MNNIKLGVSSCLMGLNVRHDGGHKNHDFVSQQLAAHFQLQPFCPEAAAGLGIPRRTIHLQQTDQGVRLLEVKNHDIDVTELLDLTASNAMAQCAGLSGYVLKKDSPSCGMERVRIYQQPGHPPRRDGVGLFAAQLLRHYPDLPVEEEGRLMDPRLRENFIERVYTYHRWQTLMQEGLDLQGFQHFHQQHKMQLLAHDEAAYRELGPLVAATQHDNLARQAADYIRRFMQAMKQPATRKRHSNVLMHIFGYLKHDVAAPDKQEFLTLLDKYRKGLIPLVVPMTLLHHHLRHAPKSYIASQHYMNPYPDTLMLRNNL